MVSKFAKKSEESFFKRASTNIDQFSCHIEIIYDSGDALLKNKIINIEKLKEQIKFNMLKPKV